MIFSSISFLYYFLPIIIILYFTMEKKSRNIILLIGSLFFYLYGDSKYLFLLIITTIFNYLISKKIESSNKKKLFLILGIIINFLILFYFKYYNFFLQNINSILNTNFNLLSITLPLGISFYTFQNTSYLIDVYKEKVKSSKSLLSYATYLLMFPHLLQGPIVRYETISTEIDNRDNKFNTFSNGVSRFIIGLSKKVLLANVLGELSKNMINISSKTVLSYWIKAISDTLELYLDFSGYSDMAIGLGLMFGFHFLENFNYPLTANSITEFWRRWHISLSSWFKDYVYIPLGGSKVGNLKRYINILIVWLLTGLWHGASWNFIIWGLYFAIILIIEKKFLYNYFKKHKLFGVIWTNFIVIIGFVIFNQTNFRDIQTSISSMFGLNKLSFTNTETIYYLKNYLIILIISIISSTPLLKLLIQKIKNKKIINIVEPIIYIILLILSTAFIIDESFNPFLYFRF